MELFGSPFCSISALRLINHKHNTSPAMPFRLSLLLFTLLFLASCKEEGENRKPNIVIIFLDDSGWADFEPFGGTLSDTALLTPNVVQLAREGTAFHNFYVPQAICSASRSALLTGCYPGRTKVFGAHSPNAWGLDTAFATLGEQFLKAGYATAAFGKWHCGDRPETRSYARGFQETCGLMVSNDMWKYHPENPAYWGQWPLRYWENGVVTIEDVTPDDQKNFTRWYTEKAVEFIHNHRDGPFLLYVAHNMPHVPLYCSDRFEGSSGRGLYWDVILEIDWSVGQINRALKENGVESNTLVILTSDNGPWISYGNHAGLTPYREAKGTSFDGGVRSACIIKFPGKVKPGSRSERAFGSVDMMPTLCHLAGIPLPENEIDGEDVWGLIVDRKEAVNPHRYYAFSNNRHFDGVMSGDGRWKLHLPHPYRTLLYPGKDGMPGRYIQAAIDTSLFDMVHDPYETTNVLQAHREVANALILLAEQHKQRFYPDQK